MASPEQEHILILAERIGRAFMDAYHERDGVFDELKAEGDTSFVNTMRGALAVIGELEVYKGGEGEGLIPRE